MSIAGTIARNTTYNLITDGLELVIGFITGILLTRSLGTEQYGIYAYLTWFLFVVSVIINLGLGEMTRRFIAESVGSKNNREPAGFVQLALLFRTAASIVVTLALVVSSAFWARLGGGENNQILFVIIGLTVLPQTLQHTLIPIFKGFQKYEYVFYVHLATNPLRVILIIALMTLGFGVQEVLIANAVALVLGVTVGFFLLRRFVPLKDLLSPSLLVADVRKKALIYSFTAAGILALNYLVHGQAETFLVGLFSSVEDVGFYTLGLRISSMLGILPGAFGAVLLPAIAEQFGRGDIEKVKQIHFISTRYLLLMSLPMAVGGAVLAKPIIVTLYGAEYVPAIVILQVTSLSFAIGHANASAELIRGINRPGFILKMMLIFAVLKIGLSLWLIPAYGILGAAIATSVLGVFTPLVSFTFVYRNMGATWPVLDTIKLAAASLIMGVAVYVLQSQIGAVPSLVLGIPLGIVIYIIAIFALGVVKVQDIKFLEGIQGSLPMVLRKRYVLLVGLMEKLVISIKQLGG